MKIIGLFVVVFSIASISRAIGGGDLSIVVGVVIGGGAYILTQMRN